MKNLFNKKHSYFHSHKEDIIDVKPVDVENDTNAEKRGLLENSAGVTDKKKAVHKNKMGFFARRKEEKKRKKEEELARKKEEEKNQFRLSMTFLVVSMAILAITTIPDTNSSNIKESNIIESESVSVSTSEKNVEKTFANTETPKRKDILQEEFVDDGTPSKIKIKGEENETSPTKTSSFNVHFIDVGQADAALVECDGHYMLIDGGNRNDSDKIYSILKKNNIKNLDIVVGTHAHEDHIGGIPGALNFAKAELVLSPVKSYDSKAFENFVDSSNLKGNGIVIPKVGDSYDLGSSKIKILGVNSEESTNNTSIVLRIDYRENSFIFTGDAEREAEEIILNSGENLKADVLKVGHHGSDTSTTYPFLREVMPKYAVISCGKDNSYGHPDEGVLSKLRDADVKVFRTDLQGDIKCSSDGKTITFSVGKNKDIDVFDKINNNYGEEFISEPSDKQNSEIDYETKSENEPEEKPQSNNENMVWISGSGKKYHSNPYCSNMKSPRQVTEQEAINMGRTPCKKCY